MTLGENIRQLRKLYNLTQKELAEALAVSKANVSKYESNDIEPNVQTLGRLSKLFNVSIDYLTNNDVKIAVNPLKLDKDSIELLSFYKELDPEDQKEFKNFADFLKTKKGMNKNDSEISGVLT